MSVKEYLKQAFYVDKRITGKLEQLDRLNALATKATSTLSDMPKSPGGTTSGLEATVVKIVALQEEINRDIDALVDLKRDIAREIFSLSNKEAQTILEKRYLCFETWEKIAVDMNRSIQYCFMVHRKALKKIKAGQRV